MNIFLAIKIWHLSTFSHKLKHFYSKIAQWDSHWNCEKKVFLRLIYFEFKFTLNEFIIKHIYTLFIFLWSKYGSKHKYIFKRIQIEIILIDCHLSQSESTTEVFFINTTCSCEICMPGNYRHCKNDGINGK